MQSKVAKFNHSIYHDFLYLFEILLLPAGVALTVVCHWLFFIMILSSILIWISLYILKNLEICDILIDNIPEAIVKFGTNYPKDNNMICSVCHKTLGEHEHPYICPNNAFYNFKTGKFCTRLEVVKDDNRN